jgi:lysophospholipase L1-like esterase
MKTMLFILLSFIILPSYSQYSVKFGMSYNNQPTNYYYEDVISDSPDLFLPDTIYAMSGVAYYLAGEAIGYEKIGEGRIIYDYICSIGTETGDNFSVTETATVPEYYNLTVQAKYSRNSIVRLIEQKSTVLCVLPAAVKDTTKIMFVGNSLTESGSASFIPVVNSSLTGTEPVFIGTKGTSPNYHEGVGGYTFWSYIYNSANSFWNGSASNLTWYRAQHNINRVDYALIQLGINDILANTVDTASIRGAQMTRIKALIDIFLTDDSVKNIVICLEPKCESLTLTNVFTVGWDLYKLSTGYAYDENYYMKKMQYLWNRIHETYGNYKYSSRVSVLPVGLNIDRATGYNYNALHPIAAGYQQMGRSYAAFINYLMQR